jgi:hypothetical protein
MGDQVFENPQNALLNGILRQTFVVRDLNNALVAAAAKSGPGMAGEALLDANGKPTGYVVDPARLYVQLLESLINLQVAVNSMMDSTKNPMVVKQGKLPPQGVKQMLEKKEGLFRKNMMVSACARAQPLGPNIELTGTLVRSGKRRANVSITRPDLSSLPTSTSRRMRLEFLPSLLAN